MQNAESHLSAPFVAANQQTRTELSRTEGDGTGAGCGTRAVMWKNRWISIRTCLRASRGEWGESGGGHNAKAATAMPANVDAVTATHFGRHYQSPV